MPPRGAWIGGLVVLGALTVAVPAFADVQACLASSEKGQRARASGKLREAREHFLACGADSCPSLVRHDCAQWNGELAATLPSVAFGARDKQGRDLFDVTVSMDGEVLVKKLDGKSVTIDPGKHTFRFEAPGYPTQTEVALVKEGERARVINVTFDGGGTPTTTAGGGTTTTTDDDKGTSKESAHSPYPWIVVGVGAVGVAVGAAIFLTAPDVPRNCNDGTKKCTRESGQSDADFRATQEQAGTADSQPVLGLIVGGISLAVVVGGLVWHFLEPSSKPKSQDAPTTSSSLRPSEVRVLPWTTGQSSGVALGARF